MIFEEEKNQIKTRKTRDRIPVRCRAPPQGSTQSGQSPTFHDWATISINTF